MPARMMHCPRCKSEGLFHGSDYDAVCRNCAAENALKPGRSPYVSAHDLTECGNQCVNPRGCLVNGCLKKTEEKG